LRKRNRTIHVAGRREAGERNVPKKMKTFRVKDEDDGGFYT